MGEIKFDVIAGININMSSGLASLVFQSGNFCHVESGYGVRVIAAAFGATDDLLEKIEDQAIFYEVDEFNILQAFTPNALASQELIDEYNNQKLGGI